MKKRKYLSVIAAALLTISPVVATTLASNTTVVKAASTEEGKTITFTKVPTLRFKVGTEEGLQTIAD
ncbi:hypothetical protein [Lactobacillus kefiranofaciens]|uniref:Uncharacterized protein n=1 Tax=Lactobacillus kefiranofaciens TaxID=267818 RepID=A0AAX3UDK4_9LACO|nr:hypothetical protein [Lactobacillus kefiranofaciens]AEG41609.1 hypothetical protein WANG_p1006 [Lactobacillus kefiranofaciens subsp. kefiranofaciens]KRM20748.1 hypothetical protein FC93_GL001349 [Lactobacillus kefiranofaciens subsp. kefiranofaciens DSM 5016 = JCM 6985]QFQ68428.1 hypothetical protein LKK75_08590 [Lactobacillus kefiranofaciens subsp. kefiranofaciens]WGO85776.1 hypothetical protein QEJ78_10815 [Lactobacillus kefiranofaciens]WQH36904.1 hypothetical protein U2870_04640 [Lactobac